MKDGSLMEVSLQVNPAVSMLKLLAKNPRAAVILIKNKMSCPGCGMSAFCTLRDACTSHKVSLEQLLNEIRAVTID